MADRTAVSAALKAKVPSPKQIDTAGPSSAGPLWHSHRRSRPDPRSQQLQTIACWRQPAHKNRRPDSGSGRPVSQTQRGRTPSLAGYSSCMRARHDVGHGADVELAGCARRRACLQTLAGSCRAVLPRAAGHDRAAPPARASHRSPASDPLSRPRLHTRSYAAGRCSPPLTRASSPPLTHDSSTARLVDIMLSTNSYQPSVRPRSAIPVFLSRAIAATARLARRLTPVPLLCGTAARTFMFINGLFSSCRPATAIAWPQVAPMITVRAAGADALGTPGR